MNVIEEYLSWRTLEASPASPTLASAVKVASASLSESSDGTSITIYSTTIATEVNKLLELEKGDCEPALELSRCLRVAPVRI